MSSTSYLYEFKMSLFDHGETAEFLLFIKNFNMPLMETWMLGMYMKIRYLFTPVFGEAFFKFDLLFAEVKTTETLNVDYYIKGLVLYFSAVDLL